MSQISYRANLSAAIFPLSLAQAGRSVIVPGPDNVYDRRVDPEGEQKNAGIPQAIYLENVIPTANGYQSVGYDAREDLPSTDNISIWQIPVRLAGIDQLVTLGLLYKANNEWYSSGYNGLDAWERIYDSAGIFPFLRSLTGKLTYGIVRGVGYVLFRDVASTSLTTFEYIGPHIVEAVMPAPLTGIVESDIVSICSSFNYLIAATEDGTIYWSSTTTATDFVPSLVTGAGSARPNNTNNIISTIEACAVGFYIFCASGIILAQYTGNSRYPWKFVSIPNTTEIVSFTSQTSTSAALFAVDGTGSIRAINGLNCDFVAPELSGLLRQFTAFDTYNSTTDVLSTLPVVSAYEKRPKIYFAYNRYLLLSTNSVANEEYRSIYVFDLHLKRYGRLKVTHTDILLYNTNIVDVNRERIGIVNKFTGECWSTSFDLSSASGDHSGVLILGKFQYVRSRNLIIHEVQIEGTLVDVSLKLLPSLNGKTFDTAVAPYVMESSNSLLSTVCRTDAKNHSVVVKGKFAVETLKLTFTPTSSR